MSQSFQYTGKNIQVAVVEPVGGQGGMDFWNNSMCNALAEIHWQPLLLTASSLRLSSDHFDSWDIFDGVFSDKSKLSRGFRYVIASIRGLTYARTRGARIAHFHLFHAGILQLFSILLAKSLRYRVVISAHDVGSFRKNENRPLLMQLYKISDAIIVYSDFGRESLLALSSSLSSKTFVAPHGHYVGFLPTLPSKEDAKACFGYGDDDIVLLFFGQIKRVKRLDILLRALHLARDRGSRRLNLLVAGKTSDADLGFLNTLIDELDLRDNVQMHTNYVSNDDLPKYFAAADVAVLPYEHIFQSGVLLLAISYYIPVLTSDIPGMTEIIEDKVTGVTFRVGNIHDLSEKLLDIEHSRVDLSALAHRAYLFASERHTWLKTAQATEKAYRCAVDREYKFNAEETLS